MILKVLRESLQLITFIMIPLGGEQGRRGRSQNIRPEALESQTG